MIAIVVLALIVCALTIDYVVLRLQQPHGASEVGLAGWTDIYYVDPSHVWLARETSGLVRLGFDEVARLLIGRPERIEWMAGKHVTRGAPLAVVVSGARRLTLRSPVDGDVVAENQSLAERPSAISTSPLHASWLVRMRPAKLAPALAEMRTGKGLREWSEQELARLRAFILARMPRSSTVGATAADGGSLDPDMARYLDDGAFADAVRMLLAEDVASGKAPPGSEVTP
jgi:glycine cleavage system H protein